MKKQRWLMGWVILSAWTAHADFAAGFCAGPRIIPQNYVQEFKPLMRGLQAEVRKGAADDLLDALAKAGTGAVERVPDTEKCRWNRFIFADFILYYDQLGFFERKEVAYSAAFKLKFRKLRDRFYQEWLESLEYGAKTGFTEWETRPLRGQSLEKFLARGSHHFRSVEVLTRGFGGKLKRKGTRDEGREAKYVVEQMLQARNPFSSIFPRLSVAMARDPEARAATRCVRDALANFSCGPNVHEVALACTGDNDEELVQRIFGVLASQRMYLIRDLKAWMEQNLDRDEYERQMSAFKDGSEIYFLLETVGNRCGGEVLYPRWMAGRGSSLKPYHFWSVAVMARQLTKYGFDRETAMHAALAPARTYGKGIQLIGSIYNLFLGVRPTGGSAYEPRKHRLLRQEEDLGAVYGVESFR